MVLKQKPKMLFTFRSKKSLVSLESAVCVYSYLAKVFRKNSWELSHPPDRKSFYTYWKTTTFTRKEPWGLNQEKIMIN